MHSSVYNQPPLYIIKTQTKGKKERRKTINLAHFKATSLHSIEICSDSALILHFSSPQTPSLLLTPLIRTMGRASTTPGSTRGLGDTQPPPPPPPFLFCSGDFLPVRPLVVYICERGNARSSGDENEAC